MKKVFPEEKHSLSKEFFSKVYLFLQLVCISNSSDTGMDPQVLAQILSFVALAIDGGII